MDNYTCKIATREELVKRWDYLIATHPGDDSWKGYKEGTLKYFDDGTAVFYLGFLNGVAITETCAHIDPNFRGATFVEGLASSTRAYLNAFRCDKEYEGKGYFSQLYYFMEEDLKKRGYTSVSLGVEPCEIRNIQIYFHLGFTHYIATAIDQYLPEHKGDKPIDVYVNYYYKDII